MAGNNIFGQIGESFEQIGKDVVRETVQAPKDIVGKAMESLGAGGGKKSQKAQPKQTAAMPEPGSQAEADANHALDIKKAVARAALQELAGGGQKQKEPTVWEKLKQEEEQKKEMKKKQAEANKKASLPQVTSKRKRGDLYGMKAKKSSTEIGKNTRQD